MTPGPSRDDVALLELFQRAQAQFTDRVDAVEPQRWVDPSLPGWTVADLVAHLVLQALEVPPLLAGEGADALDGRFPDGTADLLGEDPLTGWESAADAALAALAEALGEDGGLVRSLHLPSGPVPARDRLETLTAELTVHSWDLAVATGGDTELDGGLVTAALVWAERLPDDGVEGRFAPPVSTLGAVGPQDRLLARLGRRPR